jgi:pyocin large subunit-like protein
MRALVFTGAALAALTLAACDAGPSATAGKTPPTAAQLAAGGGQTGGGTTGGGAVDPRDQPAPLATDGKPIWAANRKHTAQENADYQFGKNGKDFGAASEADYVAKAHAFVGAPPAGVQKVARSNGDALLYDAKTNTFAVVTKDGAPRTMFKPRDGANYWREQVAKEDAHAKGGDDSQS